MGLQAGIDGDEIQSGFLDLTIQDDQKLKRQELRHPSHLPFQLEGRGDKASWNHGRVLKTTTQRIGEEREPFDVSDGQAWIAQLKPRQFLFKQNRRDSLIGVKGLTICLGSREQQRVLGQINRLRMKVSIDGPGSPGDVGVHDDDPAAALERSQSFIEEQCDISI